MNLLNYLLIGLLAGISAGAASFKNLGFDEANPGGSGNFQTQYVPGWQTFTNLNSFSRASNSNLNTLPVFWGFNAHPQYPLGITISSNTAAEFGGAALAAMSGKYHVSFWPIYAWSEYIGVGIRQTGDVPSDASQIQFISFGNQFELSMAGTRIPLTYTLIAEGTDAGKTKFYRATGDVSAFAGQTIEMAFTTKPSPDPAGNVNGLDGITFLTVPEPSTILAMVAGGLPLAIILLRGRVR